MCTICTIYFYAIIQIIIIINSSLAIMGVDSVKFKPIFRLNDFKNMCSVDWDHCTD